MRRLIIDGVFIHNSGTKLILEIIVNEALQNYDEVILLRDRRLDFSSQPSLSILKVHPIFRIIVALFFRLRGYEIIGANSLGSLIPGLFKWVYFHNATLLEKNKTDYFRYFYFSLSIKFVKEFYVQSNHMKGTLLRKGAKKVTVLPIFDVIGFKCLPLQGDKNDFMYISTYYPHKNFELLLDAWFSFKAQSEVNSILYLTISDDVFDKIIHKKKAIKYDVKNLGWMTKHKLLEKCSEVRHYINLSSVESFGLPFIEVALMENRKMMSLKLKHLDEIVSGLIYVEASIDSVVKGLYQLLYSEQVIKPRIEDNRKWLFNQIS